MLYIGKYLIEAKRTISGTYTVKEGTRYIADWAFYNCDNLTNIIIPNSVITIANHAFSSCDNLNNVIIGTGVKTIGNSAFYDSGNIWADNYIKYRGTQQQWNAITKGDSWNSYSYYSITYNYAG